MVRYNMLTMIEDRVGATKDNHILSLWKCDCGNTATVAKSRVKSGQTKSCGCLTRLVASKKATTHGMRSTREYSSWQAMRRRCMAESDKDYPRYGGRGIKICEEWIASFETFFRDMGPRPEGTTLDRIDVNSGYTKDNTRWASPKTQAINRRTSLEWSIMGKTFQSINDAAACFCVSEQTISKWVNGYFDARRGRFTDPKPECFSREKNK